MANFSWQSVLTVAAAEVLRNFEWGDLIIILLLLKLVSPSPCTRPLARHNILACLLSMDIKEVKLFLELCQPATVLGACGISLL